MRIRFPAQLAILILCAPGLVAQSISQSTTWFGNIALKMTGRGTAHDTAVLVLQTTPTLSGSLGRTIDEQSPMLQPVMDHGHLRFHLQAAGGIDFDLSVESDRISGNGHGPNAEAELALQPAPGLLPHDQLAREVKAADDAMFAAFDACDVERFGKFFAHDIEFYHDRTGRTGYEQNLQSLRNRCAEGIKLRRELETDTLIVNAAPGFGAIESGTHRFYSKQGDGSEHLDATARFTNVWSKKSGSWKLVRVISFDHR
jgi:ketosteroid isomerase-like protein